MSKAEEETVSFGCGVCVAFVEVEEPVTSTHSDGELFEFKFRTSHGIHVEAFQIAIVAVPFVMQLGIAWPSEYFRGFALNAPTQHRSDKWSVGDFVSNGEFVFQ